MGLLASRAVWEISIFNVLSPNLYSFIVRCCFGNTAPFRVCQAP